MNRDLRGYYAALHVAPDATPAEIQRAFRALMRLRHSDVGSSADAGDSVAGDSGTGNAGDEARRILQSFAVLLDPKSRAQYDPPGRDAGRGTTAAGRAVTGGAVTGGAVTGGAVTGSPGAGSREIPVRHHRYEQPVLRVTPVQWEPGPW
ncbi:J domain-containing protein [Arthrobacter sp. SO3]|uniref:J domain-containing protein n=1 Tax=Arthrobacter sp. SO3 TaxID=1897057 RepID=UPI001CFFF43C|nr:DnaJ domain-containing protein [Arthrobacter sp. SO3]MCB5291949.1 DnaJ-like protein [Arthrobacter sp. SO3]